MDGVTVGQIIRYVVIAAGSFLIGKGYTDAETMTTIAGAAATIATAVFGIWARAKKPE